MKDFRRLENQYRINSEIRENEIRLVDAEKHGYQNGIYPIQEALNMSRRLSLDLVEVTNKTKPSICKIIDFSKFLYEIKIKEKNNQGSASVLKEIQFTPNIGENDLQTKTNKIAEFLQKKHKVKILVQFKGREITFRNKGEEIVEKLMDKLSEKNIKCDFEFPPKFEGKRYLTIIKPK